jgi:hypothetical protein
VKTIIAGSRDIYDYNLVEQAVQDALHHWREHQGSGFEITEVVSGCARGVDTLGERWAREHHVPVKRFPANWNLYGKSAGSRRNGEMARYADALVAISLDDSPGTRNMIQQAQVQGLKVYVKKVE